MAVEASESSGPDQQLSSGFLSKLCFDIRRSVYEQLVVDLGLILHIAVTDVRPGSQNPKHFKQVLLPCIAGPEGHVGLEHWGGWQSAHTKNAEFIYVIYTFATFDLIGLQCATQFLENVPQLQLDDIRSLRVSHKIEHPIYTCFHYEPKGSPAFEKQQEKDQELARWQAKHLVYICDLLSRVKRLKDLHITFYDVTGRRLETSLLYPLVWVKNVENFQVDLPWALEHAVGLYCKNTMLPFVIRRPSLEEEHEPEAIYEMRKFKLLLFKLVRFLTHPFRPLKIPGHGDISLFSELPKGSRFHQGSDDWEEGWEHKPRLTARELAMIGLTNLLTDMPNWHIDVFNDKDTARWHEIAMKHKLISEKAWEWCLAELRDKARLFRTTNRVLALDAGACVSKSDTLVSKALMRELNMTIEELRAHFTEWRKVGLNDFSNSYGRGITTEIPQVHPKGSNVAGAARELKRLPCEVEFDGTSDTSVRITSYINNLHPIKNKGLYSMIEQLIQLVIEPWNDCLLKGEHGRVPTRIRIYGTVDLEEELGKPSALIERSHENDLKHPEPGAAFTYEEWKEGKSGKFTADKAVWEGLPEYACCSGTKHKDFDSDHEFYSIALQESFREKGLQVFVQIGSIELGERNNPFSMKFSGSDWDVDGTQSEHIAATSIYFYDVESAYHRSEVDLFWNNVVTKEDGYYDDEGGYYFPSATQDLGSITVKEGRLLSWSNALQYRLEPFTRSSLTEPGNAKFIKLMLVDSYYRICSTRNVPPQRRDWWTSEVFGKDNLGRKLPAELLKMIEKAVDGWPIGRDEAKEDRDNLLEEHRWAQEAESRSTHVFYGWCDCACHK
ncbi:uncharacterized protein EAE97_004201 [Botrytis byssoidea]|uniref:Uncharacterized protein n=1 Tax=Botrytis byssoidea TaxID=139641 RepID=A0A9P5M3W4_9HELO|nr:uncharacterized protein EAE97_004201 [Botrytis byssoidea]KAF7946952.1 hypothetical protein EAE97_004201 [Botrytis byssoidea]